MTKINYGKRDFRITNVNKDFLMWIRTDPRYKELSVNGATKKLHEDITGGKLIEMKVREKLDKVIAPKIINSIEEMIYGKKKKS